ncbi:phosphoadenosine phosphosulfate reductase family protein [Desulforhabdus sp. TSK]|uniref:phosphoadenosine phosphosulfate reductase family protein n=1 Tax=Desulforhabdus sp. TSK TaxID=2925014 RepID=UPI001FC84E82|nr:phosphoadenosine phosphosulfate reductase family protein [Desulforhabdus sp. TSK]GKT09164.1 phosphoadenosine phosphosulfate reductase [Desulforhabdus sp. TSK]
MTKDTGRTRHILALSGGKDSAALAVYLRDKIPDLEYVFLDTGHELPETGEFLDRMRAILGIDVKRIEPKRSFEDWLKIKGFYLPSPQKRWCTEVLKIKPYEDYIGTDKVCSYIGLRADEDRDGYISSKPNIIPRYPFIEDQMVYSDIEDLLESSGLGFPAYHRWRSRSGCYFCFFQQKVEWLNLYKEHKELFLKAMDFEKVDSQTGKRFTWCQDESLEELLNRADQIRSNHDAYFKPAIKGKKLIDRLGDNITRTCIVCDL